MKKFKNRLNRKQEQKPVNPAAESTPKISTDKAAHDADKADFSKFTEIQDQIGDMFAPIRSLEESVDMKSLDLRLAQKLAADSSKKELSESIKEQAGKDTSKPRIFSKEAFAWAGGSIASLLALTIAVIFIVPQLMGESSPSDLANSQPIPAVRLQPANITSSGYIATQNSFTLETESAITSNLNDAIKVTPEVPFTATAEADGDGSKITVEIEDELARGAEYTIALVDGVTFADGSQLRKDIEWVFRVEPLFAVIGSTPRDKAKEVPVDTTIEFEFNHKNISAEELAKHVKIAPELTGRYEQIGMKVVFIPNDNLAPNHLYDVTVSGEFANGDGEKLGEDYKFSFDTGSTDSKGKYIESDMVSFGWISKPVENVTNGVDVNLRTSGDSAYPITVKLYSVPAESAVTHITNLTGEITSLPDGIQLIEQKQLNIDDPRYVKALPNRGFYIVSATNKAGTTTAYKYYVKTDLGIIATQSDGNHGYVYNMVNETPAAEVSMDVYDSGKKVGSAKTNGEGFYSTDTDGNVVIGKAGESWIVFSSNEGWLDYPAYEGMHGGSIFNRNHTYPTYLSTDRPLYKPGDTVNFSGIVREQSGDTLAIPQPLTVRVVADEAYSYMFDSENIGASTLPIFEGEFKTTNEFGVVNGSFTIPYTQQQAYVGIRMYVEDEQIASTVIDVSEYSKPDQQFVVEFEKPKYFAGEPIKAVVTGTDYSGQPLAGKTARLRLYKGNPSPTMMQSDHYEQYGYIASQLVEEKNVTLDQAGRYSYSFTHLRNNGDMNFTAYRVALVTADAEYQVLSHSSALVSDYDYDIEMTTDSTSISVDEGQTKDVTLNFKSKKVWSGDPIGNKSFNIAVTRRWTEWVDTGEEEYNEYTKSHVPVYRTIQHTETVPGYDQRYTTDGNGNVSVELKDLKHGSYSIEVKFEQAVKDYAYNFYISELSNERRQYYNNIEVTPSVLRAKPGEKVKVDISVLSGGKGVYMVASSNIDQRGKLELPANGQKEIEIEIKESMAPYLSICAYVIATPSEAEPNGERGKGWSYGCGTLSVDSEAYDLDVKIESSKESYKPGEEAVLNITTTDSAGKPVSSSVSVAVVDKALLDLKNNSFAYPDLGQHFESRKRYFTFELGNPMYNQVDDGSGAGGGGGDGTSARDDFPDTAYWNPTVVTDANGRATVKFTLPDSLTTWSVAGYGASKDNDYGYGSDLFTSRIDQFLDIEVPQFIRDGDKMIVRVEAANFGSAVSGKLKFDCEGCSEGDKEIDVNLPANTRQEHEFTIVPAAGVEEAKLTAELVQGETKLDAIRYTLPVYTDGIISNELHSELLKTDENSAEIKFDLESVRKDATKVNLVVSKAFSIDSFKYAVDPGLNSTPQLASAILHDNFIVEHYDDLQPDTPKAELEKKLVYYAELLSTNQAENGGFGWFSYDAVSLESSVLAAEALVAVEELKPLPQTQRGLMAKYFAQHIVSDHTSVQDKILAFKGLAAVDADSATCLFRRHERAFPKQHRGSV
ncbi:MAG: alpha-2-macroglobulin family protein [Candidatus Dojkabacteria bacterium]|nr:MAG: alpha-2-macroglobulin family protein [Candidatus Dojkabacteria bacterium]